MINVYHVTSFGLEGFVLAATENYTTFQKNQDYGACAGQTQAIRERCVWDLQTYKRPLQHRISRSVVPNGRLGRVHN